MPKGVYPHTHIKPRVYPPEIVAEVRHMYLEREMTVAEVQAALPRGFKAQRIIERHIPERRRAVKRNQSREQNLMWKGDEAGYQAAHLRVAASRGKARSYTCVDCDEPADDWSYNHTDLNQRNGKAGALPYSCDPIHYSPRCRPCHRTFDAPKTKEGDAPCPQRP